MSGNVPKAVSISIIRLAAIIQRRQHVQNPDSSIEFYDICHKIKYLLISPVIIRMITDGWSGDQRMDMLAKVSWWLQLVSRLCDGEVVAQDFLAPVSDMAAALCEEDMDYLQQITQESLVDLRQKGIIDTSTFEALLDAINLLTIP